MLWSQERVGTLELEHALVCAELTRFKEQREVELALESEAHESETEALGAALSELAWAKAQMGTLQLECDGHKQRLAEMSAMAHTRIFHGAQCHAGRGP